MLDAFIIEELRKREELQKEEDERPVLELPIAEDDGYPRPPPSADDANRDSNRGVIVIDI